MLKTGGLPAAPARQSFWRRRSAQHKARCLPATGQLASPIYGMAFHRSALPQLPRVGGARLGHVCAVPLVRPARLHLPTLLYCANPLARPRLPARHVSAGREAGSNNALAAAGPLRRRQRARRGAGRDAGGGGAVHSAQAVSLHLHRAPRKKYTLPFAVRGEQLNSAELQQPTHKVLSAVQALITALSYSALPLVVCASGPKRSHASLVLRLLPPLLPQCPTTACTLRPPHFWSASSLPGHVCPLPAPDGKAKAFLAMKLLGAVASAECGRQHSHLRGPGQASRGTGACFKGKASVHTLLKASRPFSQPR